MSVVEAWASTPAGLQDPPRRADGSVDANRLRQYEMALRFPRTQVDALVLASKVMPALRCAAPNPRPLRASAQSSFLSGCLSLYHPEGRELWYV